MKHVGNRMRFVLCLAPQWKYKNVNEYAECGEMLKLASDVKAKINISSVLKIANASPLTAYSDLHRDVVGKNVEEAKKRCELAIKAKFKVAKARPTVESLQRQLSEERAAHAEALSKLASQKMTEYLDAKYSKKR